ncbi:succinate dehydrogenase assembly factor 4 [Aurantimonas sp. A2-1-M11]|uniref:DUF1674 domain-containing protein n=1 Tax=Aurantimonas sp. A2-1-M11 TaxID=3113712 RepID=UPI002F9480B3
MSDLAARDEASTTDTPRDRELPAAARRALAEAEERRRLAETDSAIGHAAEINGPKGHEPVRYGDWEKNGLISDF